MATSLKFDSTELINTTYVPRFGKHESAPEIQLNTMPVPHEDGSIQVSDRTGQKVIAVQGVLVGTSSDDLDSKIDAMKELFRRTNKNLDISWNAGTRRYVASCQKFEFNRDHFNNLWVPWVAEFLAPSGIAEETTETTNVVNATFTTQEKDVSNISLLGSAPPQLKVRVQNTGTVTNVAAGVEVKNIDTGERIIYTHQSGLAQTWDTIFNARLKTVDGWSAPTTPMSYYGVFPKWKPGSSNNLRIRIGDIIAESYEIIGTGSQDMPCYNGTTIQPAQSFYVPYTDSTFQGLELYLRKVGSPPNDLTVTIEGDSGGNPDGSAVATFTVTAASLATSYDWVRMNSAFKFQLLANKKYWIRLATTGGDGSNYYAWMFFDAPYGLYKKGYLTTLQGASWINTAGDCIFRVLFGGKFDNTKTYQVQADYFKRWL